MATNNRPLKTEERKTRDQEIDSQAVVGGTELVRSKLAQDYKVAQDALRYFSPSWDEYEDLIFVKSRTQDNSRRRISDGTLSSIIIERAARTTVNLPIGHVKSLGLGNQGAGQLMDLVLHKHIIPNANEQYDLATKLMLWDMYSNTYGTMPMVYDWTSNKNYTGPDCWLVPIRNFFPQQGRFSIRNSDFVFISTFVSVDTLQAIVDNETPNYDLDAIQQILNKVKNKATVPQARLDYYRNNPMYEYRRMAPWTDTGEVEVVTKYEASIYDKDDPGTWIDFCPDFGNIVIRNIDNPHKNGKIPVVLKYALPTLDSIIGLGDAEKGALLQYGTDTTLNLQVESQKLRTYPPIKIVNGNVVMPTIRFMPGAKWLMSNPNDISFHQFPDIDASVTTTYQFLKGALNNISGTTTTQVSAENTDATQGKTPKAIESQNASQSTRDALNVKFYESAVEELFNGMIDLVARVKFDDPIELYAFDQEVAQIAQKYPDIANNIKFVGKGKGKPVGQAKTIKIEIKPSQLDNDKGYLYKLIPGTTKKEDAQEQSADALNLFTELMNNFQVIEQTLNMSDKTMDVTPLIESLITNSGVRNTQDIIKPMNTGSAPGQEGASNTGNGAAAQAQDTPKEMMNFKDVAAVAPQAASAMLAQAGLPPGLQAPAQAQAVSAPQDPNQKAPAMAPMTSTTDPMVAQAKAQIASMHDQMMQQVQAKQQGVQQ